MLSLTLIAPTIDGVNTIYIDAGGSVSNIDNSLIDANNLTIIAAGDFNNVAAETVLLLVILVDGLMFQQFDY